jgi:hypothetical protein
MSESKDNLTCPHCQGRLQAFSLPDGTGWDQACQWACFNDECSYYKEGWDWMWEKYQVKASYRYRVVDKQTGNDSPLAVWSPDAMRDRIIEDNGQ